MWNRALLVVGWGALVIALLGIVLHFSAWNRRLPVLAASGATYLMFGAAVGLIVLLIARGWRSSVVAVAVLVAALWTVVPIYVPHGQAASGPGLVVMQSNLMLGTGDPETVVRTVRDRGVEVLTVEELTESAVGRLTAAGLDAALPFHYIQPTRSGGGGTGIYSRYPLRDTVNYDEFILHNISAVLEHPERGPITVFALHPVPPPFDFPAWSTEMTRIRQLLADRRGPTIVGADFNATRDHSAFRALLAGGLESAADQSGAGLLPTYPNDRAWGPVVGIDHVLLDAATAEDTTSVDIPGSDHRALVVRARLR